jgi:hypothetical protein
VTAYLILNDAIEGGVHNDYQTRARCAYRIFAGRSS